jgi:hypothetical protein
VCQGPSVVKLSAATCERGRQGRSVSGCPDGRRPGSPPVSRHSAGLKAETAYGIDASCPASTILSDVPESSSFLTTSPASIARSRTGRYASGYCSTACVRANDASGRMNCLATTTMPPRVARVHRNGISAIPRSRQIGRMAYSCSIGSLPMRGSPWIRTTAVCDAATCYDVEACVWSVPSIRAGAAASPAWLTISRTASRARRAASGAYDSIPHRAQTHPSGQRSYAGCSILGVPPPTFSSRAPLPFEPGAGAHTWRHPPRDATSITLPLHSSRRVLGVVNLTVGCCPTPSPHAPLVPRSTVPPYTSCAAGSSRAARWRRSLPPR